MRRLLWLVVVVALLIAVDSAARGYASNKIEGRLTSALLLDEKPEVGIGGFPFLASAIRGELDTMTIAAEHPNWGSGPVELTHVTLNLKRVEFSPADALRNELRTIEVGSARGTARIEADVVSEALAKLSPGDTPVPVPEDGALPVEGDRLEIGPLSLSMPTPLRGMTFERAELVDGSVELEFLLDQTMFRVG